MVVHRHDRVCRQDVCSDPFAAIKGARQLGQRRGANEFDVIFDGKRFLVRVARSRLERNAKRG
jgi:hypothetical protein